MPKRSEYKRFNWIGLDFAHATNLRIDVDSVKQDFRFTGKHLGRSDEVIVAESRGHGCHSVAACRAAKDAAARIRVE